MRNFIVTIDGKQYEVGVEEVGATNVAQTVAPVQKQEQKVVEKKVVSANGTKVNAPMPGMIKNFIAQEGATVKKGDVILILEAMKMDNDITAPCDGVVSFKVAKGSNVDTGALMAVIG